MAGKPHYRVTAKSKTTGKFQDIAAFWIGEKGISGQLDRAVEKIVLTNGAVIKPDACWFNLQVEQTSPEQESGGSQHREGSDEVEDTPF